MSRAMTEPFHTTPSGPGDAMLWARFRDGVQERFGIVDAGQVRPYRGDMFGECAADGPPRALAHVELMPPCNPRTFIGLWNNFRALAAKGGQDEPEEPLYFIKAPSSILGPQGVIRRPRGYTGKIIYEGELGIVLGKRCSSVDEQTAERAIFGYTCVNDVTAVEWLSSPPNFPQWTRAKGCNTFGPFGPVIASGLEWSQLSVRSILDGRERQNYPANDMILPPARIVSLLSRELTLLPGDLIACGTSLGTLPLRPGNRIEIAIDGIGTLSNLFEGD
jgi:2-keto-4-pentenoate hydratase/2-oxohepta-3-ene-1,7-dioic acid hydratase in catechol pathway